MIVVNANSLSSLSIGRHGENLARQVAFDVSDWEAEYGPGVVELIAQRPGDEKPYPVAVKRDGTQVIWDITSVETAVATQEQTGKCELRYYVGDVLAKSKTWRLWVDPAMDTPSETMPPEPEQGWVDQIIAVGAAAKASADAAKADADRAAKLAEEVAENAAQAAQDATVCTQAKEAAQTAQRLAETAQQAAEAAKRSAEAAEAAVSQSATDAEAAKQGADTAMQAAQEAAAAAAQALADLRALYQEMQTWAQGVVQDVNETGSAAVQSVQSAGDAQVKRVAEEGTIQTANAKAQADAAAQSAAGAAQSAQQAAESASVYDEVVSDVTQLKADITDVNGKLKSLYDDSVHDKSTNYIDLNSLTENAYIKGQEQGQIVSASGIYATDFIELEQNVEYYYGNIFAGYFAFYDSLKEFISGYGNGNYLTNPFTIPPGAKYGRFTIANLSSSGNNWIFTENSRPLEYAITDAGISENLVSIDAKTHLVDTKDNPLAQIIPFAGYGGIIRKWGIIGDSLSSGEMQCYDADGNQAFLDMYQYSWGQHFARIVGADCYNFSNGGQTAYGWVKDYGTVHDDSYIGGVGGGTWATAQANLRHGYIIALGVNDLTMIDRGEYPLGDTTTDINADYNLNAKTFVGYYAGIIQRLKTVQPRAKFFCVTPLGANYEDMNTQIRRVVANFSNTYLIDLDKYAPEDRVIDGYMLQGHLSPLGYMYTAYMINTYIDWIIKHNAPDFIDTALIGTTYKTDI